MKQSIQKLGSFPYYVFGIIFFFLSHGYSENAGLIPFSEMMVFFLIASAISIFLLWLLKKKMRSVIKAGILTGLLVFFYLFFGALQDGLKDGGFLYQLSRYRVLLPVILIITILLYFFIKNSARDFKTFTVYVNVLLFILIAFDFISIAEQFSKEKNIDEVKKDIISASLLPCDKCSKPDIYFIALDEYWGNRSLKNYFNYDNSTFNSFLKQQGFFVASDPSSNYSCTPVSIAATMDMKYSEKLKGHKQALSEDYAISSKDVENNVAVKFLRSLGYAIKNYSIFDILDQPSKFDFEILPIKLKLITSKNLLNRIGKDLLWNIHAKVTHKFNWLAESYENIFKEGNNKLIDLTNKETTIKGSPKFIYAHLMMPHFPYVYDSLGKEKGLIFFDNLPPTAMDNGYLQYLVYANGVVSDIVKKIMKNSNGSAVIILMSDHGYRSFDSSKNYLSASNNFNAVFLPQKNYVFFYDSISNVNQFRALFNTLFNQHLPMLKDSVVF